MKAASLQADGGVALTNAASPAAGVGELVLEVLGAGICGSDLHAGLNGIDTGTVLGHEMAGRVVEVGEGATDWSEGDVACVMPVIACGRCGPCFAGDRVHCTNGPRLLGINTGGAFAEHVVVGAAETYRLPLGVDPAVAALVEPLAVGLATVERAAMGTDEAVVVVGGGPIGLAVVLWLRLLGVGDIVVSDPVASRRALAERCGATATVDPTAVELAGAVRREIGRRPEVVIEAAGATGTVGATVDLAPYEGRIVVAGFHTAPEVLPTAKAFHKNLTISYSSWYRSRHFSHIVRLLEQGRLDPAVLVTHRVTLDDLPDAFEALRHPNDQGKVLVTP